MDIRWGGRKYSVPEAGALAMQQHQLGNFPAAAEIFRLILIRAPAAAEIHNNRGAALQNLHRYEEALACYDRAIELKPGYANAYFNRGSVLKKLNRLDAALASYDQAIALNPNHAEAHNNRSALLQEMRRYDEALAGYDRVLALKPNHAEAHNNRGVVLLHTGDTPAAESMFRKALELKPDFADPWFNLAGIRHCQNADEPDLKRVRELLARSNRSAEEQATLHFTLGKMFDDCCRYDEAFDHFQQANQLRNAQVAYNAALVTRMTDDLLQVFSREFLAQPFPFASADRSPLFVVGMPRSGTTLLAQILSNHRAVGTAGELTALPDLANCLPDWIGTRPRLPYPQAAQHLTEDAGMRLTREYGQALRRGAGADVPFVIDKNPLNFRQLGLIAKLFPHARIIHCTRHPLDTCLSNFFQRFPLFMDYSFDLRNIGHFFREYTRLMRHWRTMPSVKMIEIGYEEMVLDIEPTVRKMLDFLGLEWDERCLAPHTNPGAVETASFWQVRQPIYRRSIGRWRHYEKSLESLKEFLEPAEQIGS